MKKLALTIWACLVLSSTGQALSLSELQSNTRLRLRDASTDVSYQRFSDAHLTGFLNEAQRDFNAKTQLLAGTTIFGLVRNVMEYDLPADYLLMTRVTISSRALTEVTYDTLDQDQSNWTVTTSTPTQYYITAYTSTSSYRIGFVNKPSTTTISTEVVAYYVKRPVDLSASTDIPFNSKIQFVPFHDALVYYATAMGWLIQGRVDLAKPFFELYAAQTEQARHQLGTMPNFNPAMRGDRGPKQ